MMVLKYQLMVIISYKDLEVMPVIIEQIVNDDPNCCYFIRGNTYIKDKRVFLVLVRFYVFPDE